jgi:hypothetical protein
MTVRGKAAEIRGSSARLRVIDAHLCKLHRLAAAVFGDYFEHACSIIVRRTTIERLQILGADDNRQDHAEPVVIGCNSNRFSVLSNWHEA